jgi:hypothetical protein
LRRLSKLQITSPWRLLVSVSLSVTTFVLLLPFARLDFDPQHDGYMVAQAIAVRDGLSIQSEIWAMYGPVIAWLHALALNLPVGPALALRVFNSALIALTVFLIADIGRNRHRSFPINYQAGVFAAITWMLLADVWIGMPMHPWPSTLVAMLAALFLYFFTRATTLAFRGRASSAAILSVLAGCALGIMLFTRFNLGVPAILAAAVGVYIIDRGSGRQVRRQLPDVMFGAAIGAMCVIIRLVAEGSWDAYVEQAILWPLRFGTETGAVSLSRQLDFANLLLSPQVLPVAAVLLVIGLQFIYRDRWTVRVPVSLSVITVLSGILVVVVQNRAIVMDVAGSQWWQYLVSPNFIFLYGTAPNYGFLYFYFLLLLVTAATVLVVGLIERIRHNLPTLRFGYWVLVAGLALAGASGAYPQSDTRHVWWSAPIGLLLVASVVAAVGSLIKPFRNPLLIPTVALAIMVGFSGTNYLIQPRTTSPASWVTSGMELPEQTLTNMAEDIRLLQRYAGDGQKAIFLTPVAGLSIYLGKYQSVDRYFAIWGLEPGSELNDRLQGSPVVFVRGVDESELLPGTLQSLRDYELAESSGGLMVFVPKNASVTSTTELPGHRPG